MSNVILCPLCHEPYARSQCSNGVHSVLATADKVILADLEFTVARPEGVVCRRCVGKLLGAVASDLVESLLGDGDISRITVMDHREEGGEDEEEAGHA